MVLRPSIFFITAIEDALVAGPAIRNTKTAPAVTPLVISAIAIGMDAVAQTYMGSDTISIKKSMIYELEEKFSAIKSGGTKRAIAAATTSP